MSFLSDEEIIALYFERNESAVSETGRKYGAYCGSVAYNVLRSHLETEECLNDTWFSAWNSIPPKRPKSLRAFLAKISRNIAINMYNARRAEKRGGGEIEECIDELSEAAPEPGPTEQLETAELSKLISGFLRGLPETEKNIMIRRYFYTEPVKKIAVDFGLAPGNVSVMLSRSRAKLKNYLEKEGYLI